MQIRVQKDVNELLELQDRAIQALQQATLALQIALQALQDSRVEKGDQQKMVFVPVPSSPQVPTPYFSQPYASPSSTPFFNPSPFPGSTVICNTVTGVNSVKGSDFQVYNGSAQDAVMSAMSTVQTATQTASNFAVAGGSN